jgi:hypothetical protein
MVRDTAQIVGISLLSVQIILKNTQYVRKIGAWLVPFLITDDQKKQRVKIAR